MNKTDALKRSEDVSKRAVVGLVSSIFGIGLILFGFGIGKSAEPIAPVLPQITNPTVINMKTAGAKGDGVSDDSAIVQSIIKNAPNNTRFYFPAGKYRLRSVNIANRSRLIFEGDGDATILQWYGYGNSTFYTFMMTFTGVSDLIIQNLAVDNRGIKSHGGIRFYEAKRVLIQNTRAFDSNPVVRGVETPGDLYSYVFGHGTVPSEDVTIINNRIEDLQLEVDHSRRVRIEGNTSLRGPTTGAIGAWTIADSTIAEDYLVKNNTIIDTNNFALAFNVDHPSHWYATFRRIAIIDNKISQSVPAYQGRTPFMISFGTLSTRDRQVGHVFEDITVQNNTIELNRRFTGGGVINLSSSRQADFYFNRVVIKNNRITGTGQDGFYIDARRLQNSSIENNIFQGMRNGISVSGWKNSRVADNRVEGSGYAYYLDSSEGGNRFERNSYIGNPSTVLFKADVLTSDFVEDPPQRSPKTGQ